MGSAPIYLRITLDEKRSELTAGRVCDLEKWKSKSGRVVGIKEDIKSFNAFLDNLRAKAYEAHRYLFEKGKLITAETLNNRMLGKVEASPMLMKVFLDHNIKMAALVGSEFANGTLDRYKTSLNHTRNFLKSYYNLIDIDLKKIDYSFISECDFYLRSTRKCANNTALK